MCGIAGIFNPTKQEQDPALIQKLLKSMTHRGPNDEGVYQHEGVSLLHTRLAIMDPLHGQQPMQDKEYVLVYNGELYNALDLREELKQLGYSFDTECDTEVILKAFEYYQEDCIYHFNGIFAFAVYNTITQEIFLARDKLGVKPLFYAFSGNDFIFASELKTILKLPNIKPSLSSHAISELFLLGPGRICGEAIFQNIYELKRGECAIINDQQFSKFTYHRFKEEAHPHTLEGTLVHIKELLEDSIHRQLASDVEMGCLLSGGLDSSILVSIAAKHYQSQGKRLKTFSLDYVDNQKYFKPNAFQPSQDNDYIKLMVDTFNTDHTTITLNPIDLIEALYKSVEARDLPGMADVDSSLLLFTKEVAKDVSVCLSGECADEIFGGYPWYRDPEALQFKRFPWSKNFEYRNSFLLPEYQRDPEFVESLLSFENEPSDHQKMFQLNVDWFMQTLLERNERMSMANSLEVRVPFCDARILDYMYNVPAEYKFLHNKEKGLLREAMKEHLPEAIYNRKKSPFPKTHHPIYLSAIRDELSKLLTQEEPLWKILDKEQVATLLNEESTTPWYGQLMTTPQTIAYFLQVNHWLKHYKVEII